MTTITLRGKEDETKDVDADIFGHLAVHPSWASEALTITHVATGLRLPVRSYAERAVMACAEDLSKSFDWNFTERDGAKGMAAEVVPVLRSWGVYEYSD